MAVALDDCLAYEDLQSLRDRLARENVYLQEEIRREHDFLEMVGSSPVFLAMLRQVERVASTDAASVRLIGPRLRNPYTARSQHHHNDDQKSRRHPHEVIVDDRACVALCTSAGREKCRYALRGGRAPASDPGANTKSTASRVWSSLSGHRWL